MENVHIDIGLGAAATRVARAKKEMTVLVNMTNEMGFLEVIEVTGCGKAPGLRIEDWGLG